MPTVGQVIGQCATSVVAGLSSQIIAEIRILEPNVFVPFNDLNVTTEGGRLFLQAEAKEALKRAIQARGVTLKVNSAYRTCAQQFMLFEQYQQKLCGVRLAARPGKSDHEDALAIDIQGYTAWKPFLITEGWRWQGSGDPVHFSYLGGRGDIGGTLAGRSAARSLPPP